MTYPAELLAKAAQIKLAVFDVDGVFTNGQLHFGPTGDEQKVFYVQDGLGIKWLLQNNIEVAIISGRSTQAVKDRLTQLGVQHIHQGQENKLPVLQKLLQQLQLTPEQVAYAGDDLPDVPIIARVGLGIAVNNAHAVVKQQAYWTTQNTGGLGAVREICELLLFAQDKLEKIYQDYLPTHVN
jgi:3-deoxy-D-manno-octulosonate 8-phosphate phosphatase (KDO 8-P phosphatase)